jgi:phosphocarrier protein HPr
MKEATVKIKNSTGLHARPAAIVVSTASKFKSTITIEKGTKSVNIKSLLALLSLGVCKDDAVIVKAEGPDENEAIEAISAAIASLAD